MGYLGGDEYFDIHGYKKKPEIFPGEWITGINNKMRHEALWWTIEDFDYRGTWQRAINARAETIQKVQMFREAFATDRVLIPASALFEWHTNADKTKTKYEISFNEPLFAFAGIARDCEIKGEVKRCTVIITTRPNDIFAEIHNSKQRQAVVIRESDYDRWLDRQAKPDHLKELFSPMPNEETHARIAELENRVPTLFDL